MSDFYPISTLYTGKILSLLTEGIPAYLMQKTLLVGSKHIPLTAEGIIRRKQSQRVLNFFSFLQCTSTFLKISLSKSVLPEVGDTTDAFADTMARHFRFAGAVFISCPTSRGTNN